MNADRPSDKADELLFSITQNTVIIVRQTEKTQEIFKSERSTTRQTFTSDNPLILEEDENWPLGLTISEVYKSVFNTTKGQIRSKFISVNKNLQFWREVFHFYENGKM